MIFNDEEIRDNGDEMTLRGVTGEVEDLLRSGYYEVEKVEELNEGIQQDSDAVSA